MEEISVVFQMFQQNFETIFDASSWKKNQTDAGTQHEGIKTDERSTNSRGKN